MSPKITLLFAALCSGLYAETPSPRGPLTPLEVAPLPQGICIAFSSEGSDLNAEVVQYLSLARQEVLVSQYVLTDPRVIQALCAAYQKGLVVGVLLDRDPAVREYDTPRYLRSQGIPVVFSKRGTSGDGWHNQRYIIIDRELVIVTSADLVIAARKNHENLMALQNPAIAARFYNSWLREAGTGERLP